MIDKIIKVAEIAMWTILSVFIIFVLYIGLSYVASYIDFKPNAVGPTFAIEKKSPESQFEINEEAQQYLKLKINNVDENRVYVTLIPKKVTNGIIDVTLVDKVKNEDWTDENEGTWKENKIYIYPVEVKSLSINKLACTITESFDTAEFIEE